VFMTNFGDQVKDRIVNITPPRKEVMLKPCSHPEATLRLALHFMDHGLLGGLEGLLDLAAQDSAFVQADEVAAMLQAIMEEAGKIEPLEEKLKDLQTWFGTQDVAVQEKLCTWAFEAGVPEVLRSCLGLKDQMIRLRIDVDAFDTQTFHALKRLQKDLLSRSSPYDGAPFDQVRAIVVTEDKSGATESAVTSFRFWWEKLGDYPLRKGILNSAKKAGLSTRAMKAMGFE